MITPLRSYQVEPVNVFPKRLRPTGCSRPKNFTADSFSIYPLVTSVAKSFEKERPSTIVAFIVSKKSTETAILEQLTPSLDWSGLYPRQEPTGSVTLFELAATLMTAGSRNISVLS